MNLFNKYQSNEFNMILEVINYIGTKRKINRQQIIDISKQFNINRYELILEKLISNNVILQSEKNEWIPSDWLVPIPVLIGSMELNYLKYIMDTEEAQMFLKSETLIKLNEVLDNIVVTDNLIQKIAPKKDSKISEVEKNNLQILFQAINNKCDIKYEYKTKLDEEYKEAICAPYRIEYSAYDKRWWVILYYYDDKRAIKAKLKNLKNIAIGNKSSIEHNEIETYIKRQLGENKLVLIIKNERNAIERFFLLFDNQEKVETELIDENTYKATLNYFKFDEEEIIRNLFYLGGSVVVKEPDEIRVKIINRIKKSLENYEDISLNNYKGI